MQYGHFDDEAREYVIETPHTPMPWINYLGTRDFFSLISHTHGGYCFYRDAKLRRLTRFRYNDIPADNNGRYLFVRDGQDVWCPSYAPCRVELDEYTCRHGLGYTTVAGSRGGLQVSTTTFVPLDTTAEIQHVTVTNKSAALKTVSLFSYAEFCLWDALDDQMNYQRNLSLAEVEIDGAAIYHKTEYRERRNHYAVFWTNAPIAGFDTDRHTFIGPNRALGRAIVPQTGAATNSVASGWYPIGSHQIELTLAPGESSTLVIGLGYVENLEDAKWVGDAGDGVINKSAAEALMSQLCSDAQVGAALAALKSYWDDKLAVFKVRSANDKFDRSVGIWSAYQCMVTFNLSRSASYFETGIGRGMGFRDSNQDLLGVVAMEPQRARQRILDLAATQFLDGSAYHQYSPLTKRGNHDLGSGFNDDPLWLIAGVAQYLKETGDWAILSEPAPFDNDETQTKTLFEHLVASYRHVLDHRGPHGLPLIGRADWNDCLNLNCFSLTPGESFQTTQNRGDGLVAESVFIAGLFCWVAPDFIELARRSGAVDLAAEAAQELEAMRAVVHDFGWDGAWFRRAYDAHGQPVGSSLNEEGQIYIEPQGMCVMGGCGAGGRAAQALDSVAQRLAGEHGVAILAPAYRRYHPELGEISSYPPGYKENGGVFCHNNPWVIIAEVIAGRQDRALDYFQRITGTYREPISDVHGLEPYAYAQMVAGPESPRFGQAKNSWLTGTAAWAYYAATEWLLGVRPGFDGLVVNPGMPRAFGDYEVTRRYRGATYNITVTAPGDTGRLIVDGCPIEGATVPVAQPGAVVQVLWQGLQHDCLAGRRPDSNNDRK